MSNMTRKIEKTNRVDEEYVNALGKGYKVDDIDIIDVNGELYGALVTDQKESKIKGLTGFKFKLVNKIENKEVHQYWERVIEKTGGNIEGYDLSTVFDEVDEELENELESPPKPSTQAGNESSLVDTVIDYLT